MTLRVMFYVQHLLGIGHVVRALRIARALVEDNFDVKLVMGGMPVSGMDLDNLDIIQLPPVQSGADGFTDLIDEQGQAVNDSFWARRSKLLRECFVAFTPDIVLFEAYPFGRRQMRFELLPLLENITQAKNPPLVAVSVRDILQENRKQKRLEETVDILNRYFDLVLVHGDKRFSQLSDTFPLADRINADIVYTGIIAGNIPPRPKETFDVIVSAGGGAVGEQLLMASIDARPLTSLANAHWLFVTGPNLPQAAYDNLMQKAAPGITIERYRGDLGALLFNAKISISQCGYNTMADILQTRCASVVIPFSTGGETEQTRRAKALQAKSRLQMVSEQELSPHALAQAFEKALAYNPHNESVGINLDGAPQTARILRQSAEVRTSRRMSKSV